MSDAVSLGHSDHQIRGGWDQAGFLWCAEQSLWCWFLPQDFGIKFWKYLGKEAGLQGGDIQPGLDTEPGTLSRTVPLRLGGSLGQLWEAVWAGRAMGQGWIFRDQHLQHGRVTQMEAAAEAHKLPSPSRGLDPRAAELASEHPSSMSCTSLAQEKTRIQNDNYGYCWLAVPVTPFWSPRVLSWTTVQSSTVCITKWSPQRVQSLSFTVHGYSLLLVKWLLNECKDVTKSLDPKRVCKI